MFEKYIDMIILFEPLMKNMKKILHKTVFSKAALFPQQFMTEHQKLTLYLNKKQYNLTNICNKTNLARSQSGKEEEAVVVFDNRDVFGVNEQQVGDESISYGYVHPNNDVLIVCDHAYPDLK